MATISANLAALNVRSMPWQSKFWEPRISALNKKPAEHSHRATCFFLYQKNNEDSVRMDGTNIDSNGHDTVGTLMWSDDCRWIRHPNLHLQNFNGEGSQVTLQVIASSKFEVHESSGNLQGWIAGFGRWVFTDVSLLAVIMSNLNHLRWSYMLTVEIMKEAMIRSNRLH